MLDAKIREFYDHKMRPVGDWLARSGLNPDAISVVGLGLQVVVAMAILRGDFLLAGLVAILAGVADSLDGAVAKARGIMSPFGALLDSTLDRLSDALLFAPIAWLYAFPPGGSDAGGSWVTALALVALVGSFLVSYVKARAEGLGLTCNVGIVERAERLILVVAGLLFDVVPLMLAILAVLSVITFLQRLLYVRAQIKSAL
ncbi:MAG: CDP-alcohol phosphatidyltransferase family protein [Actinomycetota bacterium]|nr:CDP-alcohol phosphatidyltransferase family protein [Actinomycetota bacterium]